MREQRLFDFVRAVHCVLFARLMGGVVVGVVFSAGVAGDSDDTFAGGLQTEQGV
jgi:hypothetical protein